MANDLGHNQASIACGGDVLGHGPVFHWVGELLALISLATIGVGLEVKATVCGCTAQR